MRGNVQYKGIHKIEAVASLAHVGKERGPSAEREYIEHTHAHTNGTHFHVVDTASHTHTQPLSG